MINIPNPKALVAVIAGVAALALSACDTTAGEVPSLEDLRAEYANISEGRFQVYDSETKETLSGTAAVSPSECYGPGSTPQVCLATDDFVYGDAGQVIEVRNGLPVQPKVGDEFDVSLAYLSDRHDFSSIEARAAVTDVTASGDISAVFYAVVEPQGLYKTRRLVIEGGFNALAPAR